MWGVRGAVCLVGAVVVAGAVGCAFAGDAPKVPPAKTGEMKQSGVPAATPGGEAAVAPTQVIPTRQPTATSTPSPVPPTPIPSPTPTPAPAADVVFIRDGNLWLAYAKDSRQVPLTVDGGNRSPRWSPNGNSILFVHNVGSASEIQRIGADGKDRRRLVGGDGWLVDPEWSPSGDAVLYVLQRDTNKDGKVDERDAHEVWYVNADGSSAVRIADGIDPTWAPEGLRITFATLGKLQKEMPFRRTNAIDVINRQGKNEWALTSTYNVPGEISLAGAKFNSGVFLVRYPSWSPSSRAVSFTALGHTGMILSVSDKGGEMRTWAANYEGGFGRSTWSPGGEKLAYESQPASGVNSVGITGPNLARPVAVGGVQAGLSVRSPSWSPDGLWLAFAQEKGTRFIGIVGADGKGMRQLATGNVFDPDWNPRGGR